MAEKMSLSERLVTQGAAAVIGGEAFGERVDRTGGLAVNAETGEAAFAITRRPAWHRLGTVLEGDFMTSEQALQTAHLADWNVSTVPLTVVLDSKEIAIPGKFLTVRDNPFTKVTEPVGIVGNRYQPIQNEEAFDWTENLSGHGYRYVSAGAMRDLAKVFLVQQLPETFRVDGSDEIQWFLMTTNSHDGSGSMQSSITPIQAVCQNTVRISKLHAARRWNVRHTLNYRDKIAEAKRALGFAQAYVDEFETFSRSLTEQEVTDRQFKALTKNLFKIPVDAGKRMVTQSENKRAAFEGLYFHSPTLDPKFHGTKWGVLHAITEYEDWFAQVRKADGDPDGARARRWMQDSDIAFKDKALDLLVKL